MRLVSVIERRVLVNYRTAPEVTARLLPAPLRPQVVGGWAVSGICLIRLGGVRPAGVPFGLRSENAAHRIAVEWNTADGVARGVYIPRRETGSRINSWAGGRVFPGWHYLSHFDVRETRDEMRIGFRGSRHEADVHVRPAEELPGSELFSDVEQASEFFRRGSAGYSTTPDPSRLDGVELRTDDWRVEPVELVSVRSTFFEDPDRFPRGSAVADCALVMRDIAASWHRLPAMAVSARTVAGVR